MLPHPGPLEATITLKGKRVGVTNGILTKSKGTSCCKAFSRFCIVNRYGVPKDTPAMVCRAQGCRGLVGLVGAALTHAPEVLCIECIGLQVID